MSTAPSIVPSETDRDSEPDLTVVVPPAGALDREEVSKVVGAKNVMGTCSG